MGVSKNNGTSKSSILIGFSMKYTIYFGVPLFLETSIIYTIHGCKYTVRPMDPVRQEAMFTFFGLNGLAV